MEQIYGPLFLGMLIREKNSLVFYWMIWSDQSFFFSLMIELEFWVKAQQISTLKYYNGSTFGFKRAGQCQYAFSTKVPFIDTSLYLKTTNRDLY